MKTIAMYLPQYHRIPENDEWWGEGFTEWTAVKNAKPLFEGHNQPKEPMNDFYYNLLDKSTMEWQAKLASEYNIFGFCFYHYWFKDGRKILEKPAENLLEWKDINTHFCFCWANESWARTWSNIPSKNTWAHKFEDETGRDENDNGVLLEQKYGREKEWKEHFDYLLPFFKDERYIRSNGKPVFIIYKPAQILCLEDMLIKWNEWAQEAGLEGIYIIASNSDRERWENVNAYLLHEPQNSINMFGKKLLEDVNTNIGWNQKFSYDKTWKTILNSKQDPEEKTYVGGFINYDDTPRHSKKGSCFADVTIEKFRVYFEKLVIKNIHLKNQFIFMNAWNEWGEGMYLEPDRENGFSYLETIKCIMDKYRDDIIENSEYEVEDLDNSKITNSEQLSEVGYFKELLEASEAKLKKSREYYSVINRWMYLRNKNIEKFLLNNKYIRIAIYGVGDLGKHLFIDLRNSEISVEYFIDRSVEGYLSEIIVKSPDDELSGVDAIIVTPIMEYAGIKKELGRKVDCPIISLKEIINEAQ